MLIVWAYDSPVYVKYRQALYFVVMSPFECIVVYPIR